MNTTTIARTEMIAADQILDVMKNGGVFSGTQLATTLSLPYPTIRRAVQDLRRDGFDVPYSRTLGGYTYNGVA